MTTRRALLLLVVWFAGVFLLSLAYLSLNQPPPLAIEAAAATPGCQLHLLPNHCDGGKCVRIADRKAMT